MYDLFQRPARRFSGFLQFPELPYLKRTYSQQLKDVKAYYRRFPKRVDADNLLGNLLLHIPLRLDLDDRRYLRFVEDVANGLEGAFRFTSNLEKGQVYPAGVTLGRQTHEVLLSINGDVDVVNAARTWREWSPVRYLYHTRVDLGLPIPNNHIPGKGFGITTVDIPMLALQHRYWRQYMADRSQEQRESIYRFIGGFVLPNALDSYLDIAFFNRLARLASGQGLPKFPTPHPFYLTDLSPRVDRFCRWVLATQPNRSDDIEQVVDTTPALVKDSLREVMALPHDPITRHNEWALTLARFPYVRYVIQTAVHHHRGDRKFLNDIYLTLVEATRDNIFSGVGTGMMIQQYRKQTRELIELLEEKGHGQV